MSFIGNSPRVSNYPTYTGVGNGSTTEYTLSWVPGSTNSVVVSIEGIIQVPGTDYTISSDKITFSPAVPDGINFIVRSLGMPATSTTLAEEVLDTLATNASTQTIWVPAGAMKATPTNGPSFGIVDQGANKPVISTLDFATDPDEFAQFAIRMPKGWNEGTITFAPLWSHAATTVNFGVAWFLHAVAVSNNETLDVSFGTAQSSVDTGGDTARLYVGPLSAAITIAGTPAAEDYVHFQIYRDVSDAGDNLAIDARLHGITIYYTTTSLNDA